MKCLRSASGNKIINHFEEARKMSKMSIKNAIWVLGNKGNIQEHNSLSIHHLFYVFEPAYIHTDRST